jgi:hypothetical protein
MGLSPRTSPSSRAWGARRNERAQRGAAHRLLVDESGDISARTREACDKSTADRVADDDEEFASDGDEHVDLRADQFNRVGKNCPFAAPTPAFSASGPITPMRRATGAWAYTHSGRRPDEMAAAPPISVMNSRRFIR